MITLHSRASDGMVHYKGFAFMKVAKQDSDTGKKLWAVYEESDLTSPVDAFDTLSDCKWWIDKWEKNK